MMSRPGCLGALDWLRANLRAVAPLPASLGALLLVHDLAGRPLAALALLAIAFASFAFALRRWAAAWIPASAVMAIAALLRLLALPLAPGLSNDVYRYVWDGKITRQGFNPYLHAPIDTALEPLRDDSWRQLDHRDVETVYPPLAITLFSIASVPPAPVLGIKTFLAATDLLSCLLLLRLARRRGLPAGRTLAYAWNPLVVIEVAGMGHVDALGVAPLIGGALFLAGVAQRNGRGSWRMSGWYRSWAAGACLALGILAKLVPVLLLPAWARSASRRWLFVTCCLLLVVVAALPFLPGLEGPPPGLVTYGVAWEFNGPLFEPLWRLLDRTEAASWIKHRLDELKASTGWHGFWNRLYPWVYPQLLAKLLLGIGLGGVVLASTRHRDPVVAAHRVFSGLLVFSATVYPWYLLWMLPWASLLARTPWVILSGTAFFAYLPRLFGVALLPWPYLLMWAPLVVALAAERRSG